MLAAKRQLFRLCGGLRHCNRSPCEDDCPKQRPDDVQGQETVPVFSSLLLSAYWQPRGVAA